MYLASRRAEGTAKTEAKCGRLWFNDGSCVRLRRERAKHVWSYDFFSARAHDGRSVRILNLIDEYTRDRLMVLAERRWSSSRVISALADVMGAERGSGAPALGQWAGIRRDASAEMAGRHRRQDTVHRTRISVGERLLRNLQLAAAR